MCLVGLEGTVEESNGLSVFLYYLTLAIADELLRGDWSISRVLGSVGEIRWNSGPWRGHENLFQIPKSLRRTAYSL
ncbi:hypothetical protein BDQ94DRAFT_10701 [Aspergillus welwitschiae]|uniref:Uncharacterized protein n=1 Tax=Aspergillus welwitschiae TaxID=1341132 RepID=A0A3F3Q909_9EURO|nr:hypothetical protein BDQ94DRAFT_10701 [Aspergillus welwitschiae]RDH35226.1 hypothetical protein BDQ94DRAFT_10701 [Aspergillus welwitschiae]